MIYINDNTNTSNIYLPNVNIVEYVFINTLDADILKLKNYLISEIYNKIINSKS